MDLTQVNLTGLVHTLQLKVKKCHPGEQRYYKLLLNLCDTVVVICIILVLLKR